MAVEVLATAVANRGGARIDVASRELHVPQRNTSVERGHDERDPARVRMDGAGPLSDRADPVVGGAAVEALAVSATQDRAAFAHGDVDRAGRARDERDRRRLVRLAQDRKGAMATLEPEVLDVRGARVAGSS